MKIKRIWKKNARKLLSKNSFLGGFMWQSEKTRKWKGMNTSKVPCLFVVMIILKKNKRINYYEEMETERN